MDKYEKIIMVGLFVIMVLIGFMLPSPEKPTSDITQPGNVDLIIIHGDKTIDQGHTSVVVDTDTGCQYIILRGFRNSGRANGITARLDSNGKPICGLNE